MKVIKNLILRIIYPDLFRDTVLRTESDMDAFFDDIRGYGELADKRRLTGSMLSRRFWTLVYRVEDWLLEE